MPRTDFHLPAQASSSYPRIAPAPVADWLQVPRLLLTLAGLVLLRAWQGESGAGRLSRRQLMAEWDV